MPPVDAFLFLITASRRANPIRVGDIRENSTSRLATNCRPRKRMKEGRKEETEAVGGVGVCI